MTRLILLLCLSVPACVFSQSKDISVFGKIDIADLQASTCDFDPDAEAVVLSDHGQFYLDLRGLAPYHELRRHVRIKILKDQGLRNANIKISYRNFRNEEGIMNLNAATYNLDATGKITTTKLEKKSVYDKQITSRYAEQTFSMPEAKAGSIIEYTYVLRGARMEDWYLQTDIPVRFSRYEIDFPSEFQLHIRPICNLPYESKDKSSSNRTIKTFSMKNIPALKDEAYITCDKDYLQRIESWMVAVTVQGTRHPLLKTWPEVAKALIDDVDFGVQLKREIPRTADLDLALKQLSDPYQKMLAVHHYVRRNMLWDGRDNFWALNGVKSAWKEKTGTSGEINLILVNLLRDAGLNVLPIMVSTREHGRVTAFPDVKQFNKVMAYVEIGEKFYVLDGTDKYTASNLIPENVMFTEGMVIDASIPFGFRWKELWDPAKMDRNTVIFQAAISEQGQMNGQATITSQEYGRSKRARVLVDGHQQYINRFYSSAVEGVKVDSLSFSNQDIDTLPLVQRFVFSAPINSSGEYSYFSTNLFAGLKGNPFIADNRASDVFFGTNQLHSIISLVSIPEGYEFEVLPQDIRMSLEDKSLVVSRMARVSGNTLNTRITVEFKRPFYTPEEYADLKEFYKKMYALLDEQFVIKKKNS